MRSFVGENTQQNCGRANSSKGKGIRRDEAPRKFLEIHNKYIVTSPDVTEDELNKAAALSMEKYCSVAATLNCAITFSVQINRPEQG